MKAIEIIQPGQPEVLQLCERPRPIPGAGEVLIEVAAAGVNRPDVFQRQGNYAPPKGASDLPGLEVAGRLIEGDFSGANPFGLKLGDNVCALLAGGGYAQYTAVPLAQCLPVPAGLSLLQAAALPENYFTVWSNVFDRAQLGHGEGGAHESLLVQGGSSGIGITAIQLAHALGHRVYATAGSAAKCEACVGQGADAAINYKTEDFVARIKQLTDGRGADVILDMVAGNYVARELDALAEGGRVMIIATLGGSAATLDTAAVLRRRLTISGATLRARSISFKAAIAARLHEVVWPLLESGKVRPLIDRTFAAADAAQAHRLMESSTHIGKIMLQW